MRDALAIIGLVLALAWFALIIAGAWVIMRVARWLGRGFDL